ncbi:FHA domain-containing protein [Sorangium sp. So ce131]|uniref:FHA domain-containing protein n=1 Tax=Sorangium sp. So ce131 TaxID=3133282 RepID=UPI003F5E03A3
MLTFATLSAQCRAISQAAFERRYPHTWLVRELGPEDQPPPSFKTVFAGTSPGASVHTSASRHRISSAMNAASRQCELLPVIKRPESPWQDRILVGRALNSDIVLRDPSVSKVHAHISVQGATTAMIHARKSTNGTFLNDRPLEPLSDGVALRSGDVLRFGNVVCEFLLSGDLYRLVAR